jgi:hypothetical protein
MPKEIRKTFILTESVYKKLKAIQTARSLKSEVDAIIFAIIEADEMLKEKYGKTEKGIPAS